MTPCLRCHRPFARSTVQARETIRGKPSPYCPPCRATRKLERHTRYRDERREEQRAARTPPRMRKALGAPPDPATPRPRRCSCAITSAKLEGPLLVCRLCGRVVAA